jgi:hypothetical protein
VSVFWAERSVRLVSHVRTSGHVGKSRLESVRLSIGPESERSERSEILEHGFLKNSDLLNLKSIFRDPVFDFIY